MQHIYLTESVLAYFEQTSQNPKAIIELPTPLAISASYHEQKLVGHFSENGELQGALPACYIQCNIRSLTLAQIQILKETYTAFYSMPQTERVAHVTAKLKDIPNSDRETTFPVRFDERTGKYLGQGRLADKNIAKGGFYKAENEFITLDGKEALVMFEVVSEGEGKKIAKKLDKLPEKYFHSVKFTPHTEEEISVEDPLTANQRKLFKQYKGKDIPAGGELFYANFVAQPPMHDEQGNSFLRFSIVPQGKGGHYEISGMASYGAGVFVGAMLPNGEIETLLVAMNSGGWRDEEARISCLTLLAGKRGLILPFEATNSEPLPLYRMPLSAQAVPEACVVMNGVETVDLRSMGTLVENTATPSPAGREKAIVFELATSVEKESFGKMPEGLELYEREPFFVRNRAGSITVEEIMAVQAPISTSTGTATIADRLTLQAMPLQPLNLPRHSVDAVVYPSGSSDFLCSDSPQALGLEKSPFSSSSATVSTRKSLSPGDENSFESGSLFSPNSLRLRGSPFGRRGSLATAISNEQLVTSPPVRVRT